MNRILRTATSAAAALAVIAACGQADNRGTQAEGDIRGVEELANPDLAALASGDVLFVATTGKLTITPGSSETAVIVSKRAADGALLVNGVTQLDSLKAATVLTSAIKWIVVTAGADASTVIFDYYNGTFAPGIKPVSPATFGASSGTQVIFGSHANCAFKMRGTTGNDTVYAGQDSAASTANVLISFSGTNADIQVAGPSTTTYGFSLGLGNDVFDATNAKGGTVKTLSYAVNVHGGAGNDTIIGGSAADTIYGDEGLNTVDESTGQAGVAPFAGHTADTVYGLTTATTVTGTNSTTVTYANWAAVGSTGVVVQVAHLATALISGVTDNIDDTVGVVIGSPLNDTMSCSQLTDVPCVLEGGAGDDTLKPGLSSTNTEYLYGGDGNDTFAMNLIGNKVALIGGNISDITTTKNLYVDTVDYSAANSGTLHPNTTISMNGTAPAACNLTTATGIPPCPGTADATKSGVSTAQNTDVRDDITVAKCPSGVNSVASICTVKGNNSGDKIYSGMGSDLLTGGTSDDTFVIADFNSAGTYSGAVTKVISGGSAGGSGGNGNDTVDFSARTVGTTVRLDCTTGTCANSGASAQTAGDATASTNAGTAAATCATDATTLATAFSGISGTPTANDTARAAAGAAANTAAQNASAAIALAVANPTSASDAAAVPAKAALLTTAIATLDAANTATLITGDDSGVLTDSTAVETEAAAVETAVGAFALVSEGITLENINNAVCPAGGTESCAVTTNGSSDTIDFSGDGAVAGSSLTCNSSQVLTVNAVGLTPNCGL